MIKTIPYGFRIFAGTVAAAGVLAMHPVYAANNNNNNPTNQELYIQEAYVTFGANVSEGECDLVPDTLTISGVNFDNGDAPVVSFGTHGKLPICSSDATTIVAGLPNSLDAGDYRISVSTGPAVKDFSEYDLTVGAVGPQGEPGPAGADGADGADGAQGPQGEQGPAGTDGAQGPQGPAGADGADGRDGADGSPDTGQEILSKLSTVDGSGSGLDADTVDGAEVVTAKHGVRIIAADMSCGIIQPNACVVLLQSTGVNEFTCEWKLPGQCEVTFTPSLSATPLVVASPINLQGRDLTIDARNSQFFRVSIRSPLTNNRINGTFSFMAIIPR